MLNDLNGVGILNTRPLFLGKSLDFAQSIMHHGGITYTLPLQSIQSQPFTIPDLCNFQLIIFVSQPGVEFFFQQLAQPIPASAKIIAIGKATAAAIANHNVKVACFAEQATSEDLLQYKILQQLNQNILLIKGAHGRKLIAETLATYGANITELIVYQSTLINYASHDLQPLLSNNKINFILITSEQAFNHLASIVPQRWLATKNVICLSQRLADIAKSVIQGHILISTPDKLIKTLVNFKAHNG